MPVTPSPEGKAQALETKRLDAYFKHNYDYNDAVKLAKIWHLKDPYSAKVEAGKRLLAGQSLPVKP